MPEKPMDYPKHLDYLDSARGIAAMMVIIYHFINWRYEQHTGAKVASIFFNGSDAVSFFFVLSGFVLSYKYVILNQPLDILKYFISRFFRLWPAFFVAVLINAIYHNRNSDDILTNVFLYNRTQFWEEAILIRSHVQYYVPGWTLVIELTLSFFIPFWVVLAKKDRRLIYWLLIAYLLIGNNMRDLYMFHIHFALGVLISCIFPELYKGSFREAKWYKYRYIIILLAITFYSLRHIDRLIPFGERYHYLTGYVGIDFFHYTAIASFVFIIAIIASKKAQRILQHRALIFLGRISYGIYLMHWLLVTCIFYNWDAIRVHFPTTRYALSIVFLLYVLTTILLATVLHYLVEQPFIRLGKRITKRMSASAVIS